MDIVSDDPGESVFNSGQDLWSLKEGDSNAFIFILPMKGKNKKKAKNKVNKSVGANQSKSQKRKLKKLEEEKVKEILLSKSLETLEKYKLGDEAYSLMLSSRNIGQVETVREKRRRTVQFSKAGLEFPHNGHHFKKKGDHIAFCDMKPDTESQCRLHSNENYLLKPSIIEREISRNIPISLIPPQESVCGSRVGEIGGSDAALLVGKVANKIGDVSMQDSAPNASPLPSFNVIMKDKEDENLKVNISTVSQSDCYPQRDLITPTVVHVSRPKEIEDNRKDLPIVMMEQEIMEAINENTSVIICGETGCGKTTQVPQFLYEAGFGLNRSSARGGIIGVTQPRRVAVLATAKRVAFELGLRLGKEVGFQVRHDKRIGDNCSIKFMTDGILLRELQSNFLLRRYSVIILDEAHERSLNTDILIGMLSRIMQTRQGIYEEQHRKVLSGEIIGAECKIWPLKLVLMSATLRVEDFVSGRRIFHDPPPVIEVPARQYPVTIHFSKRTEIVDYVGQAYKKVLSIHKRLPAGGILVFVTGQREVEYLCRKLRKASGEMVEKKSRGNTGDEVSAISEGNNVVEEYDMKEINDALEMDANSGHQQTDRFSSYDEDYGDPDEDESDFSYDSKAESDLEVCDDGNILNDNALEVDGDSSLSSLKTAFEVLAGKRTSNFVNEGKQVCAGTPDAVSDHSSLDVGERSIESSAQCNGALCVLPLYAMLPAPAQLRVFEEIKEGERLVVVATNVAETSLTIPGIKYVVDTGREKVKNYSPSNGMETYEVQWISKASAAQRAGRSGRTGPGHCYRLYSSAVFNDKFSDFSTAEISKIPVDGVVLLMKSMGIAKVVNFPFPTPPEATAVHEAERCLKALEALDEKGRMTPLGKAMALYPMSPRHSRMLLTAIQIMRKVKVYARANLVLGYAVAAAAALSMSNPFIFEGKHNDTEGTDEKKSSEKEEKLRRKKVKETARVSRAKFSNLSSDALTIAYALQCFELSGDSVEFCKDSALHLKTMQEMSKLRQQLLHLVFRQNHCDLQQEFSWNHGTVKDVEIAWRVPSNKHPLLLNEEELLGQAICAGWADRVAKRTRAIPETDRKVNAVCYQACLVSENVFLNRRSSVSRAAPEYLVYSELLHTNRPYIHGATSVKSNWLIKYAKALCTFSAPLVDPKPYYEPLTDQVLCWVSPTFGTHLWQLPLYSLPVEDDVHRAAVFAYSLLEGHVLPCLKNVKKFMATSPSSLLRPEASGHRRVGNLLCKLNTRVRTIDSCAVLREAWRENPKELHSEIMDWFQEGFHDRFEEIWETMQQEVLLETKERFPKRVKREKSRGKD